MDIMTLKELSEHPERASEEDIRLLKESMSIVRDRLQRMKYTSYGITMESGRSQEEIASDYYVETMLMSAILEAFVTAPELEYKDINKFVFNYTDKAFLWDVPISDYHACLTKMALMGLINITKEDDYNPVFSITDEGSCALRQKTYASLAQTALFNVKTQQLNDKSLELNKRAVKQNQMMLIVAIASSVAAFLSVIFAFKGV